MNICTLKDSFLKEISRKSLFSIAIKINHRLCAGVDCYGQKNSSDEETGEKIIAIVNQKGGVGKTTTTVSLGMGLVREGKKVLLIDADRKPHNQFGILGARSLRRFGECLKRRQWNMRRG